MNDRQASVFVVVGLLMALPACADEKDEQIIGPPPTIGCCWGNVPDDSPARAMVADFVPGNFREFPNAYAMN